MAVARNLQKVPELVASRDSTYTWPNSSQRVSVFSPYEVGWFMTSLCERRHIDGIKATSDDKVRLGRFAMIHLPSDLYA